MTFRLSRIVPVLGFVLLAPLCPKTGDSAPLLEEKLPRKIEPSRAGVTTSEGRRLGVEAAHGAPRAVPPIDVLYYGLRVAPSVTQDTLSGTVYVQMQIGAANVDSVTLDAAKFHIFGVHVNGGARGATYNADSTALSIQVGSAAPGDTLRQSGDVIWVAIDYGGKPHLGYYVYPRNSYTMSEPEDARRWIPSVDEPNDKAHWECWITVPTTVRYVGSNGKLISVDPAPPSDQTWHWKEDHPIATYLMCMTMGDYQAVRDSVDGLPLLYLVFDEDVPKIAVDFEDVPDMMRLDEARYGPFPFDKYGMAAVTPFSYGGMEHQSLTTITRSWIRGDKTYEDGIAHELSHQWFGDKVTPAAWNDIWLNEGFATYNEALWEEHWRGLAARRSRMTNAANTFFSEYLLSRYPTNQPPVEFIFTPTVYDKGAWILHMLRRQMGDPVFFNFLYRWVNDHAYGNVTSADLEAEAEMVSGQNLSWFFNQWVYDKGYPVFEYSFDSQRQGAPAAVGSAGTGPWTVNLHLKQTQASIDAPLFRIPMDIAVETTAGERRFSITSVAAQEEYAFQVDAQPTDVKLDPDEWVLKRVVPHSDLADSTEPAAVQVEAFYPNPVTTSATLRMRVPHLGPPTTLNGETAPQTVAVELFDVRGRRVGPSRSLTLGPGVFDVPFDLRDGDGRRLRGGTYILRVITPAGTDTRRVVVLP